LDAQSEWEAEFDIHSFPKLSQKSNNPFKRERISKISQYCNRLRERIGKDLSMREKIKNKGFVSIDATASF
jgi:hypothetical protein